MKFGGYLDIKAPLQTVVDYFKNVDLLGEYQDGFVSKTTIEGNPWEEGTRSIMEYKHDKMEMILEETILENKLPASFKAFYYHKHMDNTMESKFIALDENNTRFEFDFEYTRINWIMPRLMAILFPGVYKKQAFKWMNQFKTFVENDYHK